MRFHCCSSTAFVLDLARSVDSEGTGEGRYIDLLEVAAWDAE